MLVEVLLQRAHDTRISIEMGLKVTCSCNICMTPGISIEMGLKVTCSCNICMTPGISIEMGLICSYNMHITRVSIEMGLEVTRAGLDKRGIE